MKYRAVCPCCGRRLPRNGYFHPNHQCPACGSAIQPEPKWNQAGNAIGSVILWAALLTGASLGATFGLVGWIACIGMFVGVLALGWVFYPYCTPYEAVRPVGAAAATPEPARPGEPTVVTRVTNRVYEIPPVPRYWRMTAVGLILCFVAAVLWAGAFKCRSTCRGYGPFIRGTTTPEQVVVGGAEPEAGPPSQPAPARQP
jgi:hypothetical protein